MFEEMYTQVKVVCNRLGIDGTTDIMMTAFHTLLDQHKPLSHDTLPTTGVSILFNRQHGFQALHPGKSSSPLQVQSSIQSHSSPDSQDQPSSRIRLTFHSPTANYPVINIQDKANSSICSKTQNFKSQFHPLISLHHSISSSHLLPHRSRSPFQSPIRHSKSLSQLTQRCYKSPFQSPIQHSNPLYQPA